MFKLSKKNTIDGIAVFAILLGAASIDRFLGGSKATLFFNDITLCIIFCCVYLWLIRPKIFDWLKIRDQ